MALLVRSPSFPTGVKVIMTLLVNSKTCGKPVSHTAFDGQSD
jgi:hypothetical protein